MSDWLDEACRASHDAYEQAAAGSGWDTQERSRVPWEGVPEANKVAMRAGIAAALRRDPARLILTDLIAELRACPILPVTAEDREPLQDMADRAEARLREVKS